MALVILRGNQFILAAREKFYEIAQELARLGQPPIALQGQNPKVAA